MLLGQFNFNQIPLWAIVAVLLIFIILLSVALITGREVSIWQIKIGEKNKKVPVTDSSEKIKPVDADNTEKIIGVDNFLNDVIRDETIRGQTLDLINELKNIKAIKSPLFKEAISIDFSEFLSEVKNWTRSSVKLQGNENDNFLIKLYKNATNSVFSTCIMDYFDAWKTDFGEKLLESHKNNQPCRTTRVFIFHDKKEMTEEIIEFIKKQVSFGVTPFILLDELNQVDDFTIIDGGDVIGITNKMKFGKRLTTWYFEDPNQTKRFLNAKEIILNKANPLP